MTALVFLADTCDQCTLPNASILTYRKDVTQCRCSVKYVNDPFQECVAFFVVPPFFLSEPRKPT